MLRARLARVAEIPAGAMAAFTVPGVTWPVLATRLDGEIVATAGVCPHEDVGLADPNALRLAMAARDAVHFLGMPEGALALAEATVYLALAPKSNALYTAYGEAGMGTRPSCLGSVGLAP